MAAARKILHGHPYDKGFDMHPLGDKNLQPLVQDTMQQGGLTRDRYHRQRHPKPEPQFGRRQPPLGYPQRPNRQPTTCHDAYKGVARPVSIEMDQIPEAGENDLSTSSASSGDGNPFAGNISTTSRPLPPTPRTGGGPEQDGGENSLHYLSAPTRDEAPDYSRPQKKKKDWIGHEVVYPVEPENTRSGPGRHDDRYGDRGRHHHDRHGDRQHDRPRRKPSSQSRDLHDLSEVANLDQDEILRVLQERYREGIIHVSVTYTSLFSLTSPTIQWSNVIDLAHELDQLP